MTKKETSAAKKPVFYAEAAYILGVICIALGTALIALSEIGVALPLVPAHVIHGLLHEYHFITLGLVEIGFQVVLFFLLAIILKRIKKAFLISMATSVIYAAFLDLFLFLFDYLDETLIARIIFFVAGFFIFALGETLFHHTYIQPEFYEFFVHSLSDRYKKNFFAVKFIFEVSLCMIGVAISFIAHGLGFVHGLGLGTLVCAIFTINMSHVFSRFLNRRFEFKSHLSVKKYFLG